MDEYLIEIEYWHNIKYHTEYKRYLTTEKKLVGYFACNCIEQAIEKWTAYEEMEQDLIREVLENENY